MWNYDRIVDGFQHAAVDPLEWSSVLHDLSRSVGGVGAVMVSGTHKLPGAPVSKDIGPMLDAYYAEGWNQPDVRFRGADLAIRNGVAGDQHFVSPEEMRTSPYYRDWLERFGCKWVGAIAFEVDGEFWFVSIQRTAKQGLFEPEEMKQLATLCRPLGDAATLSRRLAFARVLGMTDALELTDKTAVVLDEAGRVVGLNDAMERHLGQVADVVRGTLTFRDAESQRRVDRLVAQALAQHPIAGPASNVGTVRDINGGLVKVKAVALRGWARYTFTQASVLLFFDFPKIVAEGVPQHLSQVYGLTAAEVRVALVLATGAPLTKVAETLGISYQTVRTHLRSIYQKTGTHRQVSLTTLVRDIAPE